ncbi:hydroxyphenylacetyl-CoA thioesterase PaaI [Haliea sp. E1-2-M8]|uniref:hydroxyphenylacetyl-CoA thioesterase PaaI n=1 Tax=Haliea sp. E1-2-M8 TaxID=3064706 RepID=UPI002728F83C|nr:hydroxyphenylacetyl-CoA thioesterase PaaI [Haliea sp. E1-2-M8]MDO8861918.1 hydroxyphenylacetyl-CoA thioesterase PaaI [Haliea sp. E1-2-M8]
MSTPEQLARDCGEALWVGDQACRALGVTLVSIAPGTATMTMRVEPDMVNGHDLCHGGLIFTLADSCFAYACNSENFNTVAAGARIEFLAPARLGDQLTASAHQVQQGRRSGIYDVTVVNQTHQPIALFRGNSHRIGGHLVEASAGEIE